MPARGDDRFFGGKPGAAREAHSQMIKTYGRKDGEHVYNAVVAKRKRKAKTKR